MDLDSACWAQAQVLHMAACARKKFLRWISSRLGVGHAILFAHSAALRLKQPNTCLQCPFAQRVWELVQVWTHDLVTKPAVNAIIEDRWIQSPQNKPKDQQRTKAAVIRYTAWNLWNERNRRIFEVKEVQQPTVLQLVKKEANLRFWACGAPFVS